MGFQLYINRCCIRMSTFFYCVLAKNGFLRDARPMVLALNQLLTLLGISRFIAMISGLSEHSPKEQHAYNHQLGSGQGTVDRGRD